MILSAHKEQAFDGKTYDPLFELQSKSFEHFANKNINETVKFNDKFAFSVAEILANAAKP